MDITAWSPVKEVTVTIPGRKRRYVKNEPFRFPIDRPEVVDGRESIRSLAEPPPSSSAALHLAHPYIHTARAGLWYKGFPAFTWFECKSSPSDAFWMSLLYFFFFRFAAFCRLFVEAERFFPYTSEERVDDADETRLKL